MSDNISREIIGIEIAMKLMNHGGESSSGNESDWRQSTVRSHHISHDKLNNILLMLEQIADETIEFDKWLLPTIVLGNRK